jgi:hypothetical protein
VTDTVIVRFEGDGSGVAELSWGQHEIWCVIRDKSDSLHLASHDRTGPAPAQVTAMQPLEQTRRQRGPAGRRIHDASMRYFERLAASAPDHQFSKLANKQHPRFWQVIYESPAGYRASRTLAARLGVSTSPVLLAAYAVALSPLTSSQSVAVQLKHAYYDPVGKDEVSRRIAAERGTGLALGVFFNDRRMRVLVEKVFLYINDTPDALCYELRADSHFVSPADMAALMRRIEAVLVDAAVGDTAFEGAALGDTAEGGTRAVPAMGAVR